MRRPSPVERTARLLDTAAALHVQVRQEAADPVFAGVEWLSAGFMRVLRGEKQLRQDGTTIHVRAGELIWIPPGTRLDVRNVPDAAGAFAAEGLLIAPELLLRPAPPAGPRATGIHAVAADAAPRLAEAHARCVEALAAGFPDAVVRARVAELVAWLRARGVDVDAPAGARLGMKRLVARDPARAWTLPEVARALAMSEDTLHRRLAAEATSYSELLADVRMDHAVSLLWTTDLPVGQVALEAGYASASRFAARFRRRFGVLPSQLRARRADPTEVRP